MTRQRLASSLLFATALAAPASAQDCPVKLLASDASGFDEGGFAVDAAGDRALIGARFETQLGPSAGAAYLWSRTASGWQEDQKLLGATQGEFDEFGRAVALAPNLAAVGARKDDDGGNDAGAAYLFGPDPVTGSFVELAKLVAPDAEDGDLFGTSVAARTSAALGDVVVLGAPNEDEAGNTAGAAYVFVDDATLGWTFSQKLLASPAEEFARFGQSVAIDGEVLAVGAYRANGGGSGSGAVYVFRFDAMTQTWLQEARLTMSAAMPGDGAGFDVAISGDLLAVGAPFASPIGPSSGAVFVFRRDPILGAWTEEQHLFPADGAMGDEFGVTVATDGVRVAVGAVNHGGLAFEAGAAYVYEESGGAWMQVAKAGAADADPDDGLGVSVALDGDRLFAGAYLDDERGMNAGATYVFDLSGVDRNGNAVPDTCESAGMAYCTATPNSTGAPSTVAALGSAEIPTGDLTLWVADLPASVLGYFVVSQGTIQIPNAGGAVGTLCVGGPSIGRYAGNVLDSGPAGVVSMVVDATAIPTPMGNVAAQVGETWNFQLWHRDMGSTSNFSDAVAVTFE